MEPVENQFVGTWHLLSCEGRNESDGEVLTQYGPNPYGQLIYTTPGKNRPGNMMVVLMHPQRTPFGTDTSRRATEEQLRAALAEFTAYSGTYTINLQEGVVTHHVSACSVPGWIGVDQVRYFALDDERLTLKTPPMQIGAKSWTMELVWQRVR